MFAIIPDGILGTVICLAAERSGIAFGLGATESKQDSQSLHFAFQSIMQTRQDFSWICVIPLVRFVKSPWVLVRSSILRSFRELKHRPAIRVTMVPNRL